MSCITIRGSEPASIHPSIYLHHLKSPSNHHKEHELTIHSNYSKIGKMYKASILLLLRHADKEPTTLYGIFVVYKLAMIKILQISDNYLQKATTHVQSS